MAITKMRAYDVKAEWAIESVLDGAKHGTIGGAMYDYYTTLSDFSAGRLIATVQRLGSIE